MINGMEPRRCLNNLNILLVGPRELYECKQLKAHFTLVMDQTNERNTHEGWLFSMQILSWNSFPSAVWGGSHLCLSSRLCLIIIQCMTYLCSLNVMYEENWSWPSCHPSARQSLHVDFWWVINRETLRYWSTRGSLSIIAGAILSPPFAITLK